MSVIPGTQRVRGATRGGASQFKWDDVKEDAAREHYLGASVMAPIGRWQKGRDVTWYAKEKQSDDAIARKAAERKAELGRIRQEEENMMAEALGLAPKRVHNTPQQALSDREITAITKRTNGCVDDIEKEAMGVSGVGYGGDRRGTSGDGAAGFDQAAFSRKAINNDDKTAVIVAAMDRSVTEDNRKDKKRDRKEKKSKKSKKRHREEDDRSKKRSRHVTTDSEDVERHSNRKSYSTSTRKERSSRDHGSRRNSRERQSRDDRSKERSSREHVSCRSTRERRSRDDRSNERSRNSEDRRSCYLQKSD